MCTNPNICPCRAVLLLGLDKFVCTSLEYLLATGNLAANERPGSLLPIMPPYGPHRLA